MKLKLSSLAFVLATFFSGFISCTDNSPEVTPHPVTLDLSQQSSTNGRFNLGRVLFYDNHLSVNASISCASCHKQALAFSDNVQFSKGFENRLTSRNSLPIQNIGLLADSLKLFWDGREKFLETMVLKPILNHVEMGMGNPDDIVNRVRNYPYYNELFDKAFGSTDVTADKISMALSWFVGSIESSQSRFDRSMEFNGLPLSALEQQGQELFFTKYNCNGCHQTQEPGFYETNEGGFVNIGLDPVYADNGRFNVTHNPSDIGRFKIPDLRNVELTAPYMHDGRFSTLEQVLDHYSHGIADHPNLDPRLKNIDGNAMQMNISVQEKTAIIAFLKALTDFKIISDPNFSDPFVIH